MKDRRKKELKIGGFFLTGVIAVLIVLEFAGSVPFVSKYKDLGIYFDSVTGLEKGAFVKMEGVRVGEVKKIGFSEDGSRIKVKIRVREDTPITTKTVATIRLSSLLGTRYINLSLSSAGGRTLGHGAAIYGENQYDFDKIVYDAGEFLAAASRAAKRLDSILAKVDKGEGTIGKLVNEGEIYSAAKETIVKAKTSLDSIEDLAPVSFISSVLGVAGTFY